jgi:hypothetical protein
LQPLTSKDVNTKIAQTNPSGNEKIDPRLFEISTQSEVLLEPTTFLNDKLTASIPEAHQPTLEGSATETLTPEETENAEHLIRLVAGICEDSQQQEEEGEEDNSEEAALLDTLQDSLEQRVIDNPIYGNTDEFITYFSRINIYRNWILGRMSQERFEKEIGTFVPMGNSRDEPTQFLFLCPNQVLGCKYSSPEKTLLKNHTTTCQPPPENSPAAPSTFYKCRTQGCTARPFDSCHRIDYHETENHKWIRKQCDFGCTDGVWYETYFSWKSYKHRIHDPNWDKNTTCSFPNCSRSAAFNNYQDYYTHLRYRHRLASDDIKKYIPKGWGRVHWGKRKCLFPDCNPERVFKQQKALIDHLRAREHRKILGHGMSTEEAESKIQEIL